MVVLAEPPPFSGAALFRQARLDSWLPVLLVIAAGLYLYGVHRLRARGDRWPLGRVAGFLGGLCAILAVTASGIAAYDDVLLSVHMVQHMVLAMTAPVFLALGAPVTLALRTLPLAWRHRLVALLHSRVAAVLTFPLVSYAIFVSSPFALYFTSLYRLSLEHDWLHELVHVHFMLSGCLFFWPLIGLDPLPGRWPYPARALLMLLSTPFHAVLGLTIMQSRMLLGGGWYQSLHLPWVDPAADQVLSGGILWAGGEIVSVTMLAVLIAQWMRHADREARQVDRRLDLAAAAARRASPAATIMGAPTPAAASGPGPDEDDLWQVPWWETGRPNPT